MVPWTSLEVPMVGVILVDTLILILIDSDSDHAKTMSAISHVTSHGTPPQLPPPALQLPHTQLPQLSPPPYPHNQ